MAFRIRSLGVVAAVVAAELLWVVAEAVLGLQLQAPAGTGYPEPVDIGPLNVAVAAGGLALLGWAALAVLERLTPRARQLWLGLALAALAASLAMPLSGTGVSAANRAVLVLMHLIVGTAVITVLYRTSPRRALQPTPFAARVPRGDAA